MKCSEAFWSLLKDTTHIEPLRSSSSASKKHFQKPSCHSVKLLQSVGTVTTADFEGLESKDSDGEEEDLNAVRDYLQIIDFETRKLTINDRILGMDDGNTQWSDDMGILFKIPPEYRTRTNLRYIFQHLRLISLKIEEIDEEMRLFPNLTQLDLSQNCLREITNLPVSLKSFVAFNNFELSAFSQSCYLPNLVHLGLAYNDLTELEMIPRVCPHLINLDVAYNQLTSLHDITRTLGKLPSLMKLNLSGNPVTLLRMYRPNLIFYYPNLDSIDGVNVDAAERFRSKEQEEKLDPLGGETIKGGPADDSTVFSKRAKVALSGRQKILAARYVQRWFRNRVAFKVSKILLSLLSQARGNTKTKLGITVSSIIFPDAAKADDPKLKKMAPKVPGKGAQSDSEFPRFFVKIISPTHPREGRDTPRIPKAPAIHFKFQSLYEVSVGSELRDAFYFGKLQLQVYFEYLDSEISDTLSVGQSSLASKEKREHSIVPAECEEVVTYLAGQVDVPLTKLLDPQNSKDNFGMPQIHKELKVKLDIPKIELSNASESKETTNELYEMAFLKFVITLNCPPRDFGEDFLFCNQRSINMK